MTIRSAFDKLGWGFLFIMIDFRLQGFDILPDVIGYLFFAAGLSALAEQNEMFKKAVPLNVVMIIISIFSIYERPAQEGGVYFNPFGMLIGILSLIFGLFVAYLVFRGIQQMADEHGAKDINEEAGKRWTQYLALQMAAIAAYLLLFIPPLAVVYIVALLVVSFMLTFLIVGYMRRCGERFHTDEV